MSLRDDVLPPPQVIELSVRSHLSFADFAEPPSDTIVTDIVRDFGQTYGDLLKARTGATSIRVGEYRGRRTGSAEAELVFYVFYFSLQAAVQWHQFYLQLYPIAEAWADEAWHTQLGGALVRSESVVRVRGRPSLVDGFPVERTAVPRANGRLKPSANLVLVVVSGALALVFGAGGWLLATSRGSTDDRSEEILRRLDSIERAVGQSQPQISQTVTVTPFAAPAPSALRVPERNSRRYTSDGGAE